MDLYSVLHCEVDLICYSVLGFAMSRSRKSINKVTDLHCFPGIPRPRRILFKTYAILWICCRIIGTLTCKSSHATIIRYCFSSGSPPHFSATVSATWLPDAYSRFYRLFVFGPSGFWTMAPLHYAAKFDPFLSLACFPTPSIQAQSKEMKGSNFAIRQP